jgi:hypothetical protein
LAGTAPETIGGKVAAVGVAPGTLGGFVGVGAGLVTVAGIVGGATSWASTKLGDIPTIKLLDVIASPDILPAIADKNRNFLFVFNATLLLRNIGKLVEWKSDLAHEQPSKHLASCFA